MARNVIALLGIHAAVVTEDGAAAEAIKPGHLVGFSGAGTENLVKHATAGGPANAYALERDEMGQDIDDAYAIGDQVKVGAFAPGAHIYAFVASGANLAKGAQLKSDGAGRLVAQGGTGVTVALALEDLDNSAGPGDARIRVRVV